MAEAQEQTKNIKTEEIGADESPVNHEATGDAEPPADNPGVAEAVVAGSADAPAAPATGDTEVEALRQELENSRQQLAAAQDRMLRIQADMENLRKRTARDVEHAHKYALDRFIGELLPVLDSLELGITTSDGQGGIETYREGMSLTLKKFLATLEKFGVTEVDAQGQRFNPEKHEAVTMQEQAGSEPGTVITVMQKGYELNGRLVRPAMVIVAK
jgi:molecular chaperone GrpE